MKYVTYSPSESTAQVESTAELPNDSWCGVGSTFGATLLTTRTVGDDTDGDLAAGLVWTSDIDDQIGAGGSFSATLTDGTHTITASVSDGELASGSDSVTITVGDAPASPAALERNTITR